MWTGLLQTSHSGPSLKRKLRLLGVWISLPRKARKKFCFSTIQNPLYEGQWTVMCAEGQAYRDGLLGVIAYFRVYGKYNMSCSSYSHWIFYKHSPYKQHVFSQLLLSFLQPLAGFQKPIIIIIIKNLRTQSFVPKIHLHSQLFAGEWKWEMLFYSPAIYG